MSATLVTSTIGVLISILPGLGIAIYLAKYAGEKKKAVLGPVIELLAGIPTVVIGYFIVEFLTPQVLQPLIGKEYIGLFNMLGAGIGIGIVLIPIISSMSLDAINAVPTSLEEASYALGATKHETITKVLLPAATSGVIASIVLAISRAIGETMIVSIASGSNANLSLNPLQSGETMTSYIVRISGGDISYQSVDYKSIFAIGLVLFVISILLTNISAYLSKRLREQYE